MRNFLAWLGRHWYRGFRKSSTTNDIIWYMPLFLLSFIVPIHINTALLLLLVFAYIFGTIPILVSWSIPTHSDPEEWLHRQSEWFEAVVPQLSATTGVDWQGHLATRIDALQADGRQIEAVKLYRQEAGVTWDDAYLALDNWSKVSSFGPSAPTRLQLRMKTLTEQLDKPREGATVQPASFCESAV